MEDGLHPQGASAARLLRRCVSIDLEVDPKTNRLRAFAAVRSTGAPAFTYERGLLQEALAGLDSYCSGADFVLGHNFITFDARHLEAAHDDLTLLRKPFIDTLWLNPLAFPRNPYHHLVKHYQDGRLQSGHVNDPELDASLVLTVLSNQVDALRQIDRTNSDLLAIYHYLTTREHRERGFDAVFSHVRERERVAGDEARGTLARLLKGVACDTQIETCVSDLSSHGWPLAYTLAWISVAGDDSVIPPWVRYQFPEASKLVRQIRDTPCASPDCKWCGEQNDPKRLLKRWFGFDGFRPLPDGYTPLCSRNFCSSGGAIIGRGCRNDPDTRRPCALQ